MKLKAVFVAAMLLTPTAALAAPGIVTASVGLMAGPGPGFPVVDRIPGGAHVNIHGCLRGDAWCDVSWSGDRGWISSQYLEYLYRNRYVYLPDYVDDIDIPVVPFVLSSYWSSYYAGRPWYQRRAYWSGYWQSHARFATRMPTERSSRAGVAPSVTRQQSSANVRSANVRRGANVRVDQARTAHVNGANRFNGANRSFARMPPPMARGHEAPRFSAAPAARPAMPARIAQPNAGRIGGSPMNAHAQMAAPRAAPAIPRAGGGGPVNAAPRVGGGPAAGGPPGHQHH